MLTIAFTLFGAVLLVLALFDKTVRRLPLSPAVIYLAVGALAGWVLGGPSLATIDEQAPAWLLGTELAVLLSLFAVGLRLGLPPRWSAWRTAMLLAGPGVVVAIAAGTLAAMAVLGLTFGAALLLAAILSPTDPVLASEVQIRSESDRDKVRISLTAEGALNDGTALPAVMLGLGLLGLHELGDGGVFASPRWWFFDLLWPLGGGVVLGLAVGLLLGRLFSARTTAGDRLARDELIYVGVVCLAFGLARASQTSTFIAVFVAGATLLAPLRERHGAEAGQALASRMHGFAASVERLVEAATVLAVGVALGALRPGWTAIGFGLVLLLVVRPLSVLAVVRREALSGTQRRLVAWFGIRGIGTLYYLAFVLEHGVTGEVGETMIGATLAAIAISIVAHGVSATPLMNKYVLRRPPPSEAAKDGTGAADRASAGADRPAD